MISVDVNIEAEAVQESAPSAGARQTSGALYSIKIPSSRKGKPALRGALLVADVKKALKGSIIAQVVGCLQKCQQDRDAEAAQVAITIFKSSFKVLQILKPSTTRPVEITSLNLSGIFKKAVWEGDELLLQLDVGNECDPWYVGVSLASYTRASRDILLGSVADRTVFAITATYGYTIPSRNHLLVFDPLLIDTVFPPSQYIVMKPDCMPQKAMTLKDAFKLEEHTSLQNAPATLVYLPVTSTSSETSALKEKKAKEKHRSRRGTIGAGGSRAPSSPVADDN